MRINLQIFLYLQNYKIFRTFAKSFRKILLIMNYDLLHNQLIDWYERNGRTLPWRETRDPYRIWISEIILQQTRVDQGISYYYRFIERFPDVESLATATEEDVLRVWQGLGYYSRARNLHAAAKVLMERRAHSNLEAKDDVYSFWRSLPGIGDYTAGAISSFAYNLPYPALDGNVYRVLSRLFDCDIAFDTTQGKKHFRQLAEQLLDRARPRLFNSAIMELGALHCVPNAPDCHSCPLQTWCKALHNNTVDLLPVRKPRPKVRDRYFEYHIYVTPDRHTLLHRRTANDIWKHLYEFPLNEYTDSFPATTVQCIGAYRHILSHQRIHTRFLLHKVATLPNMAECITIALNDLDTYPVSRLTMNAIEVLDRLFQS